MKKKVLIVDDQIGIRLLLEEVISQEGYEVELAMNGKEALDKIKEQTPDLLMLDYKLPVVDGVTVLQQLEVDGYLIPTVVMSGLPERAKDKMAGLKSVKHYIGKPFQLNDIRTLTHSLIGQSD